MKVQLVLNLEIDLKGEDQDVIHDNLEYLVKHAMGEGLVTGDSKAEIVEWFHEIKDLDKANKGLNPVRCDPGCPGWGVFNGTEIQRCDTCQRFKSDDEAIAYVLAIEAMDIARNSLETQRAEWSSVTQFARLLGELYGIGESDDHGNFVVKIAELCQSMDLEWPQILSILERADLMFQADKLRVVGVQDATEPEE